jgi:outer membrane receptor protein involved in Fe transport
MISSLFNRRLLAGSALPALASIALVSLGTPLFAQAAATADSSDATAAPNDDVVVTGSRIRGVTSLTSAAPISVTTAAQIEQTKSGSVEEILQRMIGPDPNSTMAGTNNGGDGASNVSLRYLGAARTLVLIDGTRLIPTGATGVANLPDLNNIPVNMIERVEVLRDGASSIYGADAIGGVVNIILKKDAHGISFDGGFGAAQHGGGREYHLGTTFAASSDRGNIMVSLNWEHRDAIDGYQRAWANDPHIGSVAEGGSAYRSQLDADQAEGPVVLKQATVVNGTLLAAGTTVSGLVGVNGQFYTRTNAVLATLLPNTVYLPNVGVVKLNANGSKQYPWNTLAGGADRKQAGFSGHYDLTDGVTAFFDGFFTKRTSEQLLRPEPLLGDTIQAGIFPGYIIPANAPGNPTTGAYAAYLTPVQFGPRDYKQDAQTYRARVGLRGTILSNFDWEIAGVEQNSTENLAIGNSGNFDHLAQIQGNFPCLDVPGGCTNGLPNVQPDYYGSPTAIFSPDQLAYLKYTRHDITHESERYVYANITGPLFKLPGGDAAISVGGEYRGEHFDYTPDPLTVEGYTANPSEATTGGYQVGAVYAELRLPILADVPFFKSLDITPSGRYDHYSNFGTAWTYRIAGNWQVVSDLRVRASFSTAFRAPQVFELFGGHYLSDNGASGDPCETNLNLGKGAYAANSNVGSGVLTAGSTCSKAVANGAAVTNFTSPLDLIPGSQIPDLQGGSSALQPEKARSINLGVVLTPRFVPGLTIVSDFFRTRVRNTILAGGIAANFGQDLILNQCYGPTQNEAYCGLIHRNASGVIYQIDSLNANAGTQTVKGLDFEVSYDTLHHFDLPMIPGSLRLDVQVSHLIEDNQVDLLGNTTKYAGFFDTDLEQIFPKWRVFANADYSLSRFTLHYDVRVDSKMTNYDGSDKQDGNYIHPYWIHSLSASYTMGDWGVFNRVKLVVGVDNLFDKDPPFIAGDSTCKCNSIGGPYDFTGRFFYTRLSTSF